MIALPPCPPAMLHPLIAIIYVESHGRADAQSSTGDYGLTQINLKTWSTFYKVTKSQLLDPATNVQIACNILTNIKAKHPTDPNWLSRYHSRTNKPRQAYQNKLNYVYRLIEGLGSEGSTNLRKDLMSVKSTRKGKVIKRMNDLTIAIGALDSALVELDNRVAQIETRLISLLSAKPADAISNKETKSLDPSIHYPK